MKDTLLISNVRIINPDDQPFKGDVYIEDGKIIQIGQCLSRKAVQRIDGQNHDWLLLPGYIDMHIHGSAGHDTMDASPLALHEIAQSLVQEGVTGFLATTMTQTIAKIESALVNVAQFEQQEGEAILLGIHVEGPFVSKIRAGAQPEEYMISPTIEQFANWQKMSCYRIKQITVAPEIEGGFTFLEALKNFNVIPSIGHSDATIEEVHQAVSLGISQATHLYNQMRPFHHRDPGVVGGVLLEDNIKVELIVDCVHSHPQAVKLAYRTKGAKGIILITDAMRAKGLQYGEYDLGGQTVYVSEKGAHLANGALAGSVLTMEQAVKNMKAITNCSLQEIVAMSSTNAAEQLQLPMKGRIEEGFDADFVLLDQQLNVQKTICRGKVVFEKS
ncbi:MULTISPECIES: N-acetylglucosamine-6-phosphate deacetylase [unclassified Lysinibacillus]|uniref:N-acetylglucosamine-6-phosphate deacetylase n=1 Tax=unclassified Lysinibacillus TaxID=2636778 RepID=UPI00088CCAA0|nr:MULTISPECIES: N-acetylglucosamine-6-phosphate deacetylase [unclassified Lysinibacillus]SCY72926.1 N-acetylglucosamine-6-phosphate deacetylase [Lysinibacillus sp. SG9]SDB35141.1 N-acetylglucosamine-6-phosphate deacetylase [Lysinibacillus sp. TC-37]SFS98211.1 N-acetylglucosamine-6-phosphate deacetylase [Lysinibacillus sp. SG55]